MAISYRGSAATPLINGGDSLAQNLMLIENGALSLVKIYIKRLIIQDDVNTLLTSVMPIIRTSRLSGTVANGINLTKVPFDTALASDSQVKIWGAATNAAELVATEGGTAYSQYVIRSHTAVEQKLSDDRNLLPFMIGNTGDKWTMLPGESLLVQAVSPTLATNTFDMHNWFTQVLWEEEAATFFSISGIVTLGGSPVTGAKVMIVQADDDILTNAVLKEVKTTGIDGAWSSTIPHGKVGAAFVQYKDGSTLYTAPGSPFLEE